ncbi:FtsW/RodA/SpoVE family cell cycle protein [Cellulomonas sp. SLBN-39]|uniref:FtsW/RodA/SpoVE family cell cycle protein n=1 Tax=Cellulomonas sp. SLBN-39 TaxID=2768446 RepID=UPI00116C799E|nr:FtsW/RodA/SpoVE family cell cycle protein [Cellulomonas sp. SLBN-39]TQL02180.1 cell elongation-specific peptidoglycan biosynthesis regulator RodA [Cellulomonas sp. SLBN-39]
MASIQPHRVRAGRGTELVLLVPALGLGIAGYVLAGLGMTGEVPQHVIAYAVGTTVLALAVHVVLRLRAPYADPVILPVVVALNGIGLAMIYRISIAYAERGRTSDFADKQLAWAAISVGLAIAVLLVLRDHRTLRRYMYTAMVAGLALVLLPLTPIGTEINGARIWVSLGPAGMQPAEFAKIAFAVFFAGYLVTHRDTLALAGKKVLGLQLPRARDLGPIIIVWAVSLVVLVLQRDLGTSLLFFGLFVAMLYVATERTSWIVIGLLLFVGGAAAAASTFGHVAARFDVWLHALDPEIYDRDPGGSGQLVRGLFGMANGGLFGTGWGQGRPDIVPYAESDFIIASMGEELGLTGLLAILVLYTILFQRGMRTAIGVRDGFGKLMAGGLSFVVALQLFIVVGGVTRLIPLTGLTTPFLAYGGSSLVANWVIVALLLRISDEARRPAPAMTPVLTPDSGVPVSTATEVAGRGDGPADDRGDRRGSDDETSLIEGLDGPPPGTPQAGTPRAGTPRLGVPRTSTPRGGTPQAPAPATATGPVRRSARPAEGPDDQHTQWIGGDGR